MSRHSPGPWTAQPRIHVSWVFDSENEFVAEVAGPVDARLIAAAPELLKLLKLALDIPLTEAEALRFHREGAALIARIEGPESPPGNRGEG